jgi:formylglycine-generating enzyme required for sulfatase activity
MAPRSTAWALALLLAAAPAGATVTFSWVTVDEPGNAPDDEPMLCCEHKVGITQPTSGYGSVPYVYQITQTEVPTSAYVEFLNAVATFADPAQLFTTGMDANAFGTITRSGTAGAWVYAAKPGRSSWPVTHADWFRAARFANWLHNGQPTGLQVATTTEDGAYTLLGQNPIGVPRNPGALYWLPSEDEWYKAAYHVPGGGYVDYATGSDTFPAGEPPPGGPDSANYCPPESVNLGLPCGPELSNGPGVPTDVGAYTQAHSPWGIQDAVGNLIEIMEDQYCCSVSPPGQWMIPARGGPFPKARGDNAAFSRNFGLAQTGGCAGCTFRVASPVAPPPPPPPPRRRCGLGAELALPVALLAAWRGARRRRLLQGAGGASGYPA